MIIWMSHERHGRMPCYLPSEVESNKKNGWVEIGPPPWSDNEQDKTSKQSGSEETPSGVNVSQTSKEGQEGNGKVSERDAAIKSYEARFGKRPHHRMSTENILKAVNDHST